MHENKSDNCRYGTCAHKGQIGDLRTLGGQLGRSANFTLSRIRSETSRKRGEKEGRVGKRENEADLSVLNYLKITGIRRARI